MSFDNTSSTEQLVQFHSKLACSHFSPDGQRGLLTEYRVLHWNFLASFSKISIFFSNWKQNPIFLFASYDPNPLPWMIIPTSGWEVTLLQPQRSSTVQSPSVGREGGGGGGSRSHDGELAQVERNFTAQILTSASRTKEQQGGRRRRRRWSASLPSVCSVCIAHLCCTTKHPCNTAADGVNFSSCSSAAVQKNKKKERK